MLDEKHVSQRSSLSEAKDLSRSMSRLESLAARGRVVTRRQIWFRDLDSNQDTQLQRLMSYRLDDPGTGPISVADARKCAQASQSTDFPAAHFPCHSCAAGDNVSEPDHGMPRAACAARNLLNNLHVEWAGGEDT